MSKSTLQPSDYVHLHNHTHHSLLDGMTKVGELVDQVKKLGMHAIAITDHGTLSGAIEFYKACKAADIKPIIGMEAYVAARKMTDRDPAKDKNRYHLILLAMNNQGYQNLMQLATKASLEGFYYKPRIDREILEKYNQGLIVLSGCGSGELGEALKNDDYEAAKKIASWYKKVFGDRYYLEIQDHNEWAEQVKINEGVFKLSKELNIPKVITGDAHYLRPEDRDAHEILLCVGTGSYLSDKNRMSLSDFHLHVTDPKDVIKRWGEEYPDIIKNTKEIADRCEVEIELGKILIPTFPTPHGESEKSYLHKLVWSGLAWRYGQISAAEASKLTPKKAQQKLTEEIITRAEYELSIMDSMGYNGYFLIVQDFINWGKDRGIIFGPGRGSAAGSIVSYSLRITEIDPLEYGLMFERFLNPNRISMPDIDIDIQDSRRGEVIDYCVEKYGKNRVANIVTFGTMAARAAMRDVARVLEVPYSEADTLAKLVPPPVQGRHTPLTDSIKKDDDLKKEYKDNPTAKRVIDFASRLEGTIRSHGVHAAGVVIAPDEIVKFVPLEMAQKGVIATQYSMGPVEELGLLKMDFLGLSNLTIINNALRIIKKVYQTDINLGDIKKDDPKTFELLQRGDTTGVFQVESAGMKRYLKELKPTLFEDIIAMNALYRPGPMSEIPRFIKGKNNSSSVKYLHKSLKPILEDTYGVMVYQEQIINLLQLVAGYSPGEADLVRKAIGKKKRDIMQAEEPKFIAGCKKQGLTEAQAKQLWAQIQPFADYSFNKAHATCYAQISYWTAYLKAHYPDAFMAALMTSDRGDIDRLAIEISECQKIGLTVLPPDVNESFVEFSVVPSKSAIRFGLAAVKGVGTGAVEEILRAREEEKFTSVDDFARRVSPAKVNRKAWEALIKSGAFDQLADRSDLLFNLDNLLGVAAKLHKEALSGQVNLFGDEATSSVSSIKLSDAPEKHGSRERLGWERELLGLYLSSHPLDPYEMYLSEQTVSFDKILPEHSGKIVTVGGLVSTIRAITTKNGSKMAFVAIEDKTADGEIIVFPKLFSDIAEELTQDAIIKVKGKASFQDRNGQLTEELKIIADELTIITSEELDNYKPIGKTLAAPRSKKPSTPAPMPSLENKIISKTLYIHIKDPDDHERLLKMKQTLNNYPGSESVVLVLGEGKQSALRLPFKVGTNGDLTEKLAKLYSPECVVIK